MAGGWVAGPGNTLPAVPVMYTDAPDARATASGKAIVRVIRAPTRFSDPPGFHGLPSPSACFPTTYRAAAAMAAWRGCARPGAHRILT